MLNSSRHRSRLAWAGQVRVVRRDLSGRVIGEQLLHNLITDAALDQLAGLLIAAPVDTEIKYLAWGDDATPPTGADTVLGNELGRKIVTAQEAGSTGQSITTVYLGPADANEAIAELGWYAGATAGAGKDSGLLLARVLYSHTKTTLESIQVERTDTIAGA
jgi:hypothetical protein